MMKKLGVFVAILIALWVVFGTPRIPNIGVGAGAGSTATSAPSGGADAKGADPKLGDVPHPYGFRSQERLNEHFQKHGREFRATSPEAYQALAEKLRDAPAGADVLEVVRPIDGVISRFDRVSGAFLAVDPDGTIRTFFKPNDGEEYFRRQAKRRPSP